MAPGTSGVYHKCFCFWYAPNKGLRHTAFRAEGAFGSIVRDFTVGFCRAEALNTVLEVGKDGGKGVFDNLRVNAREINETACAYRRHLVGKTF